MARVGVNLLVRNQAERPEHLQATDFAVRSLLDSDFTWTDWRVQIVDDASTCLETQHYLKGLHAQEPRRIQVWRSEEHLGIARGRNAANNWFQERWRPDYVVEVHTDHIFPRQWLCPLIKVMESRLTLGMLGPLLLTGRPMGWSLGYVHVDYQLDNYEIARAKIEDAAALHRNGLRVLPGITHPAVKRWSMLVELGGYDENLPGKQNYEDTEEAYRAKEAGWGIGICTGSVVWHWYAFSRTQTTPDHHADYKANKVYCEEKHGPEFAAFCEQLGMDMDAVYGGEA